ncbi:muramoyltetrapeptide carboxypeptidase [Aquimarina sp. MAR_2010_214]|uniref:S66 peptidase family protein n=1 Tax=Aquimarina sp. MAR_2010_214 TaxID=1250026 RepID=UPI000C709620|nr:LD-carboxypeptidase [Aquimarina sp. MAR_2010_214]PKV49160.1 muramoyltetrapeptide carboxypeptidase [Aquimarina sp. MAR_2010_214]
MLKPDFVKKGDKIAIVSTARKINLKEIREAIVLLETWGLVPVLGSTIGIESNQFAGSDQERVSDFQEMLDDKEIRGIWCARGGYGTVRIIDKIDFSGILKHPKWIIGYSDVTVLHSHLHTLGICSLHAPMPIDIHKGTKASIASLRDIIFGKKNEYILPSSKKNIQGDCKGQLVGGNLSILYSLCGSTSSIDTTGKILCIEDLDEYLYHIDRMLQNFKRNGYFDNLSGLIVGGMTKMHDNNISFGKKAKRIILDIVQEYDFPVAFKFPMGHIEDNRTLIMGAEVFLQVHKNQVTLEYI